MNAKTEARVKAHGVKLLAIFPGATPRDPVKLCRKLRRIECAAGRDAERFANGDIDSEAYRAASSVHLHRAKQALGTFSVPVFVNGDPRGYALKIKSSYTAEHNLDIERDWGGYGLIAPDLTA